MPEPSATSPLSPIKLLQIQRELCDIPRGRDRFEAYLQKMMGPKRELALPLSQFNPMAKEHVAARLNELLELGAEEALAKAIADTNKQLGDKLHPRPAGLVMADDFGGGWTNRHQMDAGARFGKVTRIEADWLVVLCWSSEQPTAEDLRLEILAQIYRGEYRLRHGQPVSLADMLRQEGAAQCFAGAQPEKSEDELGSIQAIIDKHRASDDYPTAFACLYGDEAATSVGYTALGVPPNGGFALALWESLKQKIVPEDLLG